MPRGFRGNTISDPVKESVWDNGRDWKAPCIKEGGWIRIYPLTRSKSTTAMEYIPTTLSESRIGDSDVKNTVLAIQKYLKAAKEVHKKNEKLSDAQSNALLRATLELNTEIWLPEK